MKKTEKKLLDLINSEKHIKLESGASIIPVDYHDGNIVSIVISPPGYDLTVVKPGDSSSKEASIEKVDARDIARNLSQ